MLDMGFRPAVDRIVRQCPQRPPDAVLLGHARRRGRPHRVRLHRRRRPPRARARRPSTRPRSSTASAPSTATSRIDALVEELRAEDRELALVFVRTKRGADRLVKRLGNEGVRAVAMHGNKSQNQRERALAEFGSGKVDTLVATDVAARGIDVTGISHVINFDAPDDRDSYVHRIGRTGRAGRTGIGITFVEAEQARDVGKIAAALSLHDAVRDAPASRPAPRPHTTGGGRQPPPPRRARARSRGRSSRRALAVRWRGAARRRAGC